MTARQISVLVVDDSQVARMLLVHLLQSDPQIRVVGAVHDGQAALHYVQEKKPDVVLMDIQMPRLDGFEATRRIMETNPVPIVICTAARNPRDVSTMFHSMEAGAVACLEKPVSPEHPDHERTVQHLIQTVKLMSEVKVVRRWPRSRPAPAAPPDFAPVSGLPAREVRMIGIGASTGGPPVLQTILASLPKGFPAPILVVQHIATGFLPGLAEWLNQTTGFRVHIGAYGVCPLPEHVYLAPDGFHMGINNFGRIVLTQEEPESGLRPAVSYLLRSLATVFGRDAVGVLLSGMGRDGAAELKLMRDKGAVTIAQDRETSVVHGMPGSAIELGAATHILPPEKIADMLVTLVTRRNGKPD